ncbi:DUF2914 domain-containing protein [candidate division KSB1 bacterium]|nr:DUF2914 domain-containing protein [candidate division KSB1 bacterium]
MSTIKSIFKIKISWLLQIVFILFAIFVVLKYQRHYAKAPQAVEPQVQTAVEESIASVPTPTPAPVEEEKKQPTHHALTIEQAVICLDVENGRPLIFKSEFSKLVDHLYCYVRVNSSETYSMSHRWIYDDRLVHEETFSVSPGEQILVSKMEMIPAWQGSWLLQVMSSGQLLTQLSFELI